MQFILIWRNTLFHQWTYLDSQLIFPTPLTIVEFDDALKMYQQTNKQRAINKGLKLEMDDGNASPMDVEKDQKD